MKDELNNKLKDEGMPEIEVRSGIPDDTLILIPVGATDPSQVIVAHNIGGEESTFSDAIKLFDRQITEALLIPNLARREGQWQSRSSADPYQDMGRMATLRQGRGIDMIEPLHEPLDISDARMEEIARLTMIPGELDAERARLQAALRATADDHGDEVWCTKFDVNNLTYFRVIVDARTDPDTWQCEELPMPDEMFRDLNSQLALADARYRKHSIHYGSINPVGAIVLCGRKTLNPSLTDFRVRFYVNRNKRVKTEGGYEKVRRWINSIEVIPCPHGEDQ